MSWRSDGVDNLRSGFKSSVKYKILKNGQKLMESILIIDDEPFIRENVQRVLHEDGYHVL